jgi:beta-lactamase superfamily II metal-dependent hydrolase
MSTPPFYFNPRVVFNGIEVDVIDAGDADCIVVTQWQNSFPHRILIDGGCGGDVELVLDFLLRRGYTNFWAAVCTHLHNDHARGLVKLVRNPALTVHNGWMHNVNRHISAESLRRASAVTEGVEEVVEATKELAAAFASRGIGPKEPFAGMCIAAWPDMNVLGPSLSYYCEAMTEFTKVNLSMPIPMPAPAQPELSSLYRLAALGSAPKAGYNSLASLFPAVPPSGLPPLFGALVNSSVKKNPTTQPFNNTSVLLGVNFNGAKLLFSGDAGSEALSHVGSEWHDLLYMGVPHHGSDGNLSKFDIERFRPKFAIISAKGDSHHPDRAIVSGLVKVGTTVGSTHEHGNLWFYSGVVPARSAYKAIEGLKGTGSPTPLIPRW